jgi:hypothetical protein
MTLMSPTTNTNDSNSNTQNPGPSKIVYRDPCTGEIKRPLPHVSSIPRDEYDLVAVKVVPKKKDEISKPSKQPCQQRKHCPQQHKTQCYTCGPRRVDCYSSDPKCYGDPEYYDCFEDFDIGQCEENDWNYFTGEGFIANDGKTKVGSEGVFMTARKFRKTYPDVEEEEDETAVPSYGWLDHFKTFAIRNSRYSIPDCGELYAEFCVSGRTYGTDDQPFGNAVLNPQSDFRLAAATVNMLDLDSGLHIAIAFTNDSIWAIYEMLPFDDDGEEGIGRASFASATLIGRRNGQNPMSDFVQAGLALDRRKGAKWYLNGCLVHQVNRLGFPTDPKDMIYDVGGTPQEVQLKCAHIGFGLMTYLDGVSPQNYRDLNAANLALSKLTDFKYKNPWIPMREVEFVFEDNPISARLFGQGASIKVKEIKVENRC